MNVWRVAQVCCALAIAVGGATGCNNAHDTQSQDVERETVSYEEAYEVRPVLVTDYTSAFAQIDSVDAVSARARIAGTVQDLAVDEGDEVESGDVLAVIRDERLALQAGAEGAEAAALRTQVDQARRDLKRYEELHAQGYYPTQRLEEARARVATLSAQLRAALGQRAVTEEIGAQGQVLAPVTGRVLRVPVTIGGVVIPGEEVALVGTSYVLRLRLPERNAQFLKVGLEVDVEQTDGTRGQGRVAKIYPALVDGRVEADIEAEGLASRVFGERVRVWTPADERSATVIPEDYLTTRFGVDFVRLVREDGTTEDTVVRVGAPVKVAGMETAIEVLSGLGPGDRIAAP